MPNQKDLQRKLIKAINVEYIKFLQQLGKETAIEAQKLVPVVTGQLKKSFSIRDIVEGAELSYNTSYAYDVHEGQNTEQLDAPWVSSIPKHKRKLQSGKIVNVRKHTKTYKFGYKPIPVSSGWAALNINEMERTPNRWIQDAWRIIYNKQDKDTKKVLPKALMISQRV